MGSIIVTHTDGTIERFTEGADMQSPFKATHIITITDHDGTTRQEQVMLEDGCAYTQEEWEACEHADWTVDDDGAWLFLGEVPWCREYSVSRVTE